MKLLERPFLGVFIVLLAVIAIFLVLKSFVAIETGEVGIKSVFGKYDKDELQPGLHIINPFTTSVIKVDTKVHTITYKAGESGEKEGVIYKPEITVRDKRGLPVAVELSVQYRLKPEFASEMFAKWGSTWEEKLVNPVVRSAVRDVIGNYAAEDIPSHRNEIEKAVIAKIKQEVDKASNGYVEVIGINMRKLTLPETVMQKIEEVQRASLEAQKMKEEILVAKRQQEAERIKAETQKLKKVIAAKAEAEVKLERIRAESKAKEIRAQAEANATLTLAAAKAQANKLLANSINDKLIKWKMIDVYKLQAQALYKNPNIKIWMGAPKNGFFLFHLNETP